MLFATRWIPHFCTPVVILLAGTSAYLISKQLSRPELYGCVLRRGLWLVFLEVTVTNA